jgi:UDP-N-acetylglucosamine 2-epimerase (non-hydrolysing)
VPGTPEFTPSGPPGRSRFVHVIGDEDDALRLAPLFVALEASGAIEQTAVAVEPCPAAALWRSLLEELRPGPAAAAAVQEWPRLAPADTAASLLTGESALPQLRPAVVIVGGPSDAALGWALAAAKLRVPVAGVEAGLRDYDWGGAGEINRVLLDTIADSLFTPTRDAVDNLVREGIEPARVHHAGPTVIDVVRRLARKAGALAAWRRLGLERGSYVLAVLGELDDDADDERIARTTESLAALARTAPVVLPLGDRGRGRLTAMGDLHRLQRAGVRCVTSGTYLSALSLKVGAGAVVTDVGTVQDEMTALGVACFTLRATSERMVTVTQGTNVLLGRDARDVADLAECAVLAREPVPAAIPRWDGRAAERIARSLVAAYALVPVRRAS